MLTFEKIRQLPKTKNYLEKLNPLFYYSKFVLGQSISMIRFYYYINTNIVKTSEEYMKVQRALSYNDLKKRRCLREEKSKDKLKYSVAASTDLTTEKKNPTFLNYNFQQKFETVPNYHNQVVQIRKLSHSDRSPNTIAFKHQQKSRTDRVSPNIEKYQKCPDEKQMDIFQENNFDSKEILRALLNDQKKNQSILTLKQLRDKIKQEKERSRSKNRIIAEETPKKIVVKEKQPLRIRKFETLQEKIEHQVSQKSKRKLIEVPRLTANSSPIKSKQAQQKKVKDKKKQERESPKILDLLNLENDKQLVEAIQEGKTAKKQRKKLEKFKKYLPQALLNIS